MKKLLSSKRGKSLIFKLLPFVVILVFQLGCKKSNIDENENNGGTVNLSAADKIAGVYNGSGKYLPGQINLGTVTGCTPPAGWQSKFQIGSSTVNIIKLSDSLVKITLSSGPYPAYVYNNVKVKQNGSSVEFAYGSVDTDTKFLMLSAYTNKSFYISTNACLNNLPYIFGSDLLGFNNYTFQTIDHIDFTGTKQ